MRILNPKLLASFRTPGPCEMCGRWSSRRVPHHIIPRGSGGGKRLDISLNLVRLGSEFECSCHLQYHRTGELQPEDFWREVGKREGCTGEDAEAVCRWYRHLPKDPLPCQWDKALGELTAAQRELVTKTEANRGI